MKICGANRRSGWWSLTCPGYAIGGLSVGEPREHTRAVIESTLPLLPSGQAALRDGRRLSG